MAMELMQRPWGGGDLVRDYAPPRTMADRLFERAFAPLSWSGAWSGGVAGFGVDVYETDDGYAIHCLLPAVDPSQVSVTMQDSVLTISGESAPRAPEGAKTLFQEIGYGRFRRQVALPAPVDAGQAEATYDAGILRITLPKAEDARPKAIRVQAGEANTGG
jgi:HSP20 family protein